MRHPIAAIFYGTLAFFAAFSLSCRTRHAVGSRSHNFQTLSAQENLFLSWYDLIDSSGNYPIFDKQAALATDVQGNAYSGVLNNPPSSEIIVFRYTSDGTRTIVAYVPYYIVVNPHPHPNPRFFGGKAADMLITDDGIVIYAVVYEWGDEEKLKIYAFSPDTPRSPLWSYDYAFPNPAPDSLHFSRPILARGPTESFYVVLRFEHKPFFSDPTYIYGTLALKLSPTGTQIWDRYFEVASQLPLVPPFVDVGPSDYLIIGDPLGSHIRNSDGDLFCEGSPTVAGILATEDGGYYLADTVSTEKTTVGHPPEAYWQRDYSLTRVDGACQDIWSTTHDYFDDHDDPKRLVRSPTGDVILIGNSCLTGPRESADLDCASSGTIALAFSNLGALHWVSSPYFGFYGDRKLSLENPSVATNNEHLFIAGSNADGGGLFAFAPSNGEMISFTGLFAPAVEVFLGPADDALYFAATVLHASPPRHSALIARYTTSSDDDDDGLPNESDNCPTKYNPSQEDDDSDGVGNPCDNCRADPNPSQQDSDETWSGQLAPDGVGDVCDNCPQKPNPLQENADTDQFGDACDNCPQLNNTEQADVDFDHVGDACDNCPAEKNADQSDVDGDGLGDVCDDDADEDGVPSDVDNCVLTQNPDQTDTDGDGVGDACNDPNDVDHDEWADHLDNCPDVANPQQRDRNANGLGDNCEYDLSIAHVEITQAIQDDDNSMPLVRGKDTWLRVYVDVGSAKMRISPVATMVKYYNASGTQIYPSGWSSATAPRPTPFVAQPLHHVNPNNREDTLNIFIPGSWMWPTAVPYVDISLIDLSGKPDTDPWNNSIRIPLYFNSHAPVNLVFIPLHVNGCEPTLGDFLNEVDFVERLFPIAKIQTWRLGRMKTGIPSEASWWVLTQLGWRAFWTNNPGPNTKYYGLACRQEELGAGPPKGSSRSTYLAWGYLNGGTTMAHELGHHFHRNHVKSGSLPGCDDPPNIDENYPQYYDRRIRGRKLDVSSIGFTGFSRGKTYDPEMYTDIMSYCRDRWISPYTYGALASLLLANGSTQISSSAQPARQGVLVASGTLRPDGSLQNSKIRILQIPGDYAWTGGTGDWTIEQLDDLGNLLATHEFAPSHIRHGDGETGFFEHVVLAEGHATVQIRGPAGIVQTATLSAAPPVVEVQSPNGGESLGETAVISWTASDADGDALTFDLQYSADGGSLWTVVAVDLNERTYNWDTSSYVGTTNGMIRVVASDGVRTGHDTSDTRFTVPKKVPEAFIVTPSDGEVFFLGETVILKGRGIDIEEGTLPEDAHTWISNIDGELGAGHALVTAGLSPGIHEIKLTAIDDDQGLGEATVEIEVLTIEDTDGDGVGDDIDVCDLTPDPDQVDTDGDGEGDACDLDDTDGDGVADPFDNCPDIYNDQLDNEDDDELGDDCDGCRFDPNNDYDEDGLCGDVDNCPFDANAEQVNADGDDFGDVCDPCAVDPLNDIDQDGVCGDVDNCPSTINPDQAEADGDGMGDACDPCPLDPLNDVDGDDVCGDVDNCPTTANPNQAEADGDGIGDVCDPCPLDPLNDIDGDDVCGNIDNCATTANSDQTETDGDGIGDACDPCPLDPLNDVDGDDVCGNIDNCPITANPDQADADGDGIGDACDPCPLDPLNDIDGDDVCGNIDNCPITANPDQADADADGFGDLCDVCPLDFWNDRDRDGHCMSEGDCDDANAEINPGATEVCDAIDNDCDGLIDCDDPNCEYGINCPWQCNSPTPMQR